MGERFDTSSPTRSQGATSPSSASNSPAPVLLLTTPAWPLFPSAASSARTNSTWTLSVQGAVTVGCSQAAVAASGESSLPSGGEEQMQNNPNRRRQRYMCDSERLDVIRRVQSGEKQSDIAREYGFTRAAICNTYKNRQEILRRTQQYHQPPSILLTSTSLSSMSAGSSIASGGGGDCASDTGCGDSDYQNEHCSSYFPGAVSAISGGPRDVGGITSGSSDYSFASGAGMAQSWSGGSGSNSGHSGRSFQSSSTGGSGRSYGSTTVEGSGGSSSSSSGRAHNLLPALQNLQTSYSR